MKKAQAWGFDLLIASSIFIMGIIFFYFFALNYSGNSGELATLQQEAEFVAESLLSEGYPQNWTEQDVVRIGILSQEKINETKFERFYSLSSSNYAYTKSLFKITNNYYVNLSHPIHLSSGEITEVGIRPVNPKNLAAVNRITSYNGTILTLRVEAWN